MATEEVSKKLKTDTENEDGSGDMEVDVVDEKTAAEWVLTDELWINFAGVWCVVIVEWPKTGSVQMRLGASLEVDVTAP